MSHKISCHDDMMDAKSDPQHAWKKRGVRTRTAHRPIHSPMYRPMCSTCAYTAFLHVGFANIACQDGWHHPTIQKCMQKRSILHSPVVQKSIYVGWNRRFWILPDVVLKSSVFLMCRFWHVKMDGRTTTTTCKKTMPKTTTSAQPRVCKKAFMGAEIEGFEYFQM